MKPGEFFVYMVLAGLIVHGSYGALGYGFDADGLLDSLFWVGACMLAVSLGWVKQ